MADLKLLLEEWRNIDEEDYTNEHGRVISMRTLKARLLELKDEVSYQENWYRLATQYYECHAHNLDFIAALLYLVDERPLTVSDLQPTVHLHIGHLYRSLRRGGVMWRAHYKGIGSRLRESYYPWPGVFYVDPLSGVLLRNGERAAIPTGVEIYKDVEEEAESETEKAQVMGLIGGEAPVVPVPMLRTKLKPERRPPSFPSNWRENLNG